MFPTTTDRLQSKLEFMVRFQQYIELVRTQDQGKLLEAITHAKKYLLPSKDIYSAEVKQAAGLLAFPPGARLAAYSVCTLVLYLRILINPSCRSSTDLTVGRILRSYSQKPTTASSLFQPSRCFTLLSQRAYPHSKLRLAIQPTCHPQRRHHLHRPSLAPSVQYAAQS